jgi:hypothetical protein
VPHEHSFWRLEPKPIPHLSNCRARSRFLRTRRGWFFWNRRLPTAQRTPNRFLLAGILDAFLSRKTQSSLIGVEPRPLRCHRSLLPKRTVAEVSSKMVGGTN